MSATKHEHTSGCVNTYPDCMNVEHSHGGVKHDHPVEHYADAHLHPEEVPSPGNEPAEFECTYYANHDASHCLRSCVFGKVYCPVHLLRREPPDELMPLLKRAVEAKRNRTGQYAEKPEAWAARLAAECTIDVCDNTTERPGQPCDPCDVELGVG